MTTLKLIKAKMVSNEAVLLLLLMMMMMNCFLQSLVQILARSLSDIQEGIPRSTKK